MDSELTAFLNERFGEIARQFDQVNERFLEIDRRLLAIDQRFDVVDRRFDVIDQRFEAVDGRFDSMEQRFEERFIDLRRHFDVAVEHMDDQFGLVAEGHAGLQRQFEELRVENQAAHRETRVLMQASYRDLDRRVTRLESRRKPRGR